MRKKKINKLIVASVLAGVLTVGSNIYTINFELPLPVVSVAHAEIKMYTGIGDYVLSDDVPPGDIKSKAKLYAERNALEQAGVFIGSLSVVKNAKLQDDEIVAFTAGILQIVDVQYEIIPINDKSGIAKYRAIVTAQIDTDVLDKKINEWLNRGGQERATLVEQNRSLQQTVDELQRRIAQLEQAAANATTPQDTANVNAELQSIDNETLAAQRFEEGNYTEAIALNPKYAEAYFYRGNAYKDMQNYDAAIGDFSKIIELKPEDYWLWNAYVDRGDVYFYMQNYNAAIADFNKAIELNPNYWQMYYSRGLCYKALGDNVKAQADYAKARELGYNG